LETFSLNLNIELDHNLTTFLSAIDIVIPEDHQYLAFTPFLIGISAPNGMQPEMWEDIDGFEEFILFKRAWAMIPVAWFTVELPIKSASCATRSRIPANECGVISMWFRKFICCRLSRGSLSLMSSILGLATEMGLSRKVGESRSGREKG
jgi:hypothetical protein